MSVRTATLCTLLFAASSVFANDSKIVGVYDLKGNYTNAANASLADSAVKLTVTRNRGRLTFTRTSSIPAGAHRTLLPTSWESKQVRNRGTISNDQGKYQVYEVTYPVTVREVRGATGALNNDPSSGKLIKRDLTMHYYWPTDDLTSVAELGNNTIKHHSPADWNQIRSFGNKTAEAAPTAPIAPPTRTLPPVTTAPPVVDRFDRSGFDRSGYDRNGFNRYGFDRNGYNRLGFDRYGFDRLGFDRYGYNRHGFDRAGFNRAGLNLYGYNRYGYDRYGFNRYGFDRYGYNRHGYNRNGFNRYGGHVNNRGYTRGYVPRSPGIVIGSPNNNVRIYPNGSSSFHHRSTTTTPYGSIHRSRTYSNRSRGGVSINIPLGR